MSTSYIGNSNQTPGLPGFRVSGAANVPRIGGLIKIFNALKIAAGYSWEEIFNALKIYQSDEYMVTKQRRYRDAPT
jgi:hypothetical protein